MHKGMKFQQNTKLFPSLHVFNGKSYTYGIKGVLINNNYVSDTKLFPGIVYVRRVPCSCHACKKMYLLPGIQQLNNHVISQDMVDYIITSTP